MVPSYVGVAVVERLPHLLGVLLIHAKDNGLAEAVSLLQKLGEISCNRLSTCLERHQSLEILRTVLPVRNFSAVAVGFSFGRSRPGRIHSGNDSVYAVRSQETIVNALLQ